MSSLSNPNFNLFAIDRDSVAYATGYDQGVEGREFRNPCAGNLPASANHRAGFLAGDDERRLYNDFPHA